VKMEEVRETDARPPTFFQQNHFSPLKLFLYRPLKTLDLCCIPLSEARMKTPNHLIEAFPHFSVFSISRLRATHPRSTIALSPWSLSSSHSRLKPPGVRTFRDSDPRAPCALAHRFRSTHR